MGRTDREALWESLTAQEKREWTAWFEFEREQEARLFRYAAQNRVACEGVESEQIDRLKWMDAVNCGDLTNGE